LQGHGPLLWRAWDGLHVLYHTDSGDTHVLDEIGAAVLHTLERQPALADDVCGHVAARLNQPRDPDLDQHVGQLLTELARLGLIEQVTPSNR
jgi:PqqD family protein of HPr-rel-A system